MPTLGAERPFTVFSVPQREVIALLGALRAIRSALETMHVSGSATTQLEEDGVACARHETRCQLRYAVSSAECTSHLRTACETAVRILSVVAIAALPEELSSQTLVPLLDAFYYMPNRNCSPCPAHTDPGLVTVICDDVPALEIQDAEQWLAPMSTLEQDQVLVLAGRQLAGSAAACVHRVAPVDACRTSLAFELRLGELGASQATTRDQRTNVDRCCAASTTEVNYLRAAAALRALPSGAPRQSFCSLM
mmetsp:Transcript_17290/g.44317  ORF Transcript_17290/g.44317 Transcript_17290/m.44317 type:complete len:250 (-) Transcript_17290:553-1302(-)